ncbi:MAG: FecR domain-containing protein [Alphaproteobacteria bacterium]|nr:FecR domain-containing protein [Alphaproteobacteria bacterium]
MAYSDFESMSSGYDAGQSPEILKIEGARVDLPDVSYVRDAGIERAGADLVLNGPEGAVVIEGYFSSNLPPDLVAPGGETLTPDLVHAFARSSPVYAQVHSETDVSPVGAVSEVSGEAIVIRTDGGTEKVSMGTRIYEGDVIETGEDGAVNIHFIDDTSFAVSADARLAIDEYVYDPATESGTQGFSVLKGLFVFTSGLIGRDDPDDVRIDMPTGSIGIRGTIIAGDASKGEVTLVEGAIVVRDLSGNEVSLAGQFETALILPGEGVRNIGQISAEEISGRFSGVSAVAPGLFSTIEGHTTESNPSASNADPAQQNAPSGDANGSADQNGDEQVDGSAGTDTGVQQTLPDAPASVESVKPNFQAPGNGAQNTLGNGTFGLYSGLETAGIKGVGHRGSSDGFLSVGVKDVSAVTTTRPALGDVYEAFVGKSDLPPLHVPLVDTNPLLSPPPPPANGGGFPAGGGTPPVVIDELPVHIASSLDVAQHNIAPNAYFMATEGQSWAYNFAKEFINTEPGDLLTYHLSTGTEAALNSAVGTGSWVFDNSTGHLSITFGVTTADQSFNIEILARDAAGQDNIDGFETYVFNMFDGPAALSFAIDSNGALYADTGSVNNFVDVGGSSFSSGNKVFAGNGNDNITISNGQNNIINLGNGENQIGISNNASNINNIIIGGDHKDTMTSANAQNKFFGMGGDDKIVINLSSGSFMSGLQSFGNTGILMDAGDSGFKAGVDLAANTTLQANGLEYKYGGNATGYGDTLFLSGSGSRTLDFTAIDNNYIRGIERIDAKSTAGLNVNMTLNYQDIIQMTDYKNTLIFRANGGDVLNFSGTEFSNFTKVGDDISIDDGYQGTPTNVNFDIYTDGTVTLLVEDAGATVNGLP